MHSLRDLIHDDLKNNDRLKDKMIIGIDETRQPKTAMLLHDD